MDQNWVATILWSAMIQVLYRDVQFVFHLFKPKENGVVYVQAVIADCLLVELAREDTLFTLVVPSRCPAARAKRSVGQKELAAGREVLALGGDALVVVDVVLPAVLGLVLVREAGVEAGSNELEGLGLEFLVGHDCGGYGGVTSSGGRAIAAVRRCC